MGNKLQHGHVDADDGGTVTAGSIVNVPSGNVTATNVQSAINAFGFLLAAPKAGSFTRDISLASGSQSVTGVGFKPRAILFLMNKNVTYVMGVGIAGGAGTGGTLFDNSVNVAHTYGTAGNPLYIRDSGGNYIGDIASYDSDGFTISWTKTGSSTGIVDIYYLAFP